MKKILSLFILLVLFQCSTKKESELLYKEVLALHDEVMPQMEDVSKLIKDLKEKQENAAESVTQSQKDEISNAISDLQKASSGMMNWMREFNSSYDTLPEEKAVEYLKEERLKIQQVKKDIETSMSQGKKLLNSNA